MRYSPHYFDVANGKVAWASYHAGLWVIDVHDAANLAHPRTVAYAELPALRDQGTQIGDLGGMGAFDAWWVGDYIVAGDFLNGLAVLHYEGP